MLPLGISAWQSNNSGQKRGGAFRTTPLTRHSMTHIEILQSFLDISVDVTASDEEKDVAVRLAAESPDPGFS